MYNNKIHFVDNDYTANAYDQHQRSPRNTVIQMDVAINDQEVINSTKEESEEEEIETYLPWSILNCLCCFILGTLAIMYSVTSQNAREEGISLISIVLLLR